MAPSATALDTRLVEQGPCCSWSRQATSCSGDNHSQLAWSPATSDSPHASSPMADSPPTTPVFFEAEVAAAAAAVASCCLQSVSQSTPPPPPPSSEARVGKEDVDVSSATEPTTPRGACRPHWCQAGSATSPVASCTDDSWGSASTTAVWAQQAQAKPHHAASWTTVLSFADCASRSPLVKSALLALTLDGTHPPPPDDAAAEHAGAAGELRWTLAQLLALHMRAGLPQATEASILAALWVLESLGDHERSSATTCLSDYLAHLAAFSPLALLTLTSDWPPSFCRMHALMAAAQLDLLQRLDWRLRLDSATEVRPCYTVLFHLPAKGPDATSLRSARGRALLGLQARWAGAMLRMEAEVLHEAYNASLPLPLHKRPCCPGPGPCPLCYREPEAQPGKRQRRDACA